MSSERIGTTHHSDSHGWPKVAIIVLNWNGWKDTIECVESIFRIDYQNYSVLLIDNGSSDDSISEIKKYARGESTTRYAFFESNPDNKPIDIMEFESKDGAPVSHDFDDWNGECSFIKRLVLIKSSRNAGFAGGNNIGIRFALSVMHADYILLLNNDTVVDVSFLEELVEVGNEISNSGFLSPKIYFYDYRGRRDIIQYAGAMQNLWTCSFKHIGFLEEDRGQHDSVEETDYAHGSCMLVKSTAINDIGLLDEDFFCYREENDWTLRGRRSNWRSIYVPNSKIWHKGGRSGGESNRLSVYYLNRNDFLFMKKNASRAQYVTFLLTLVTYRIWLETLRFLVFHRDRGLVQSFLQGIADGMRWTKPS